MCWPFIYYIFYLYDYDFFFPQGSWIMYEMGQANYVHYKSIGYATHGNQRLSFCLSKTDNLAYILNPHYCSIIIIKQIKN